MIKWLMTAVLSLLFNKCENIQLSQWKSDASLEQGGKKEWCLFDPRLRKHSSYLTKDTYTRKAFCYCLLMVMYQVSSLLFSCRWQKNWTQSWIMDKLIQLVVVELKVDLCPSLSKSYALYMRQWQRLVNPIPYFFFELKKKIFCRSYSI